MSAWEARNVTDVQRTVPKQNTYPHYQQTMVYPSGFGVQNFSPQKGMLTFASSSTPPAVPSHTYHPLPLLGSPKSAEAFSDVWGDRLGEMGGKLGGGMRDDFFS